MAIQVAEATGRARLSPDDIQQFEPHRAAEEQASGTGYFVELLTTLALAKRTIILSTLGAALAAACLSYAFRPTFTAVTTILPPQQSSSSSSALLSQISSLGSLGSLGSGSLGLKNPLDMYVSLMKSVTVEDAMIRRFDLLNSYRVKLMSVGRTVLEQRVKIEASAKDGLIRLSVTDRNPVRAAELANGYVEEYRKFSSNLAITEAGQRRLFFQTQLETQKDNLAKSEEYLKQTEQTSGVVELDSQARSLIQSAGTLRAQIAAKEVQIASLRTYAGTENMQLLQAQQELASLKEQLSKLGGNGSGDDLLVSKGRLPQAGLDYARKLRDVKYNETLFEILARQFEMAKLDEAKEGAPVQVVDPAIVPDQKSFPTRSLFLLVGFVAGALGS